MGLPIPSHDREADQAKTMGEMVQESPCGGHPAEGDRCQHRDKGAWQPT